MESMMTARQVAELLGVHENWVYDHAATGQLPSYKIGGARRFDPVELRTWITEHREREARRPPPRAITRTATASTSARGYSGAGQPKRDDLRPRPGSNPSGRQGP